MKKKYNDPSFELIDIRLIYDVLGASEQTKETEESASEFGDDFEDFED